MKKNKLFIFLLLCFTAYSVTAQTKHLVSVQKDSFIQFKMFHALHDFESKSKEGVCEIDYDQSTKLIKRVNVQVEVSTFDSGNSNRDSHAMEVIDALSYPLASYTSSSIEQTADSITVYGKLTFHGVTHDHTFKAAYTINNNTIIVKGGFDVSLTYYKVERPSLMLMKVDDIMKFIFVETFNL